MILPVLMPMLFGRKFPRESQTSKVVANLLVKPYRFVHLGGHGGNKSLAMTLRYSHLAPNHLQLAVASLPKLTA